MRDKPKHDPTPEEILLATAEIRLGWDDLTRENRTVTKNVWGSTPKRVRHSGFRGGSKWE